MNKKEHKLKNQNVNPEEPEILEETKELEQDTKLNNEMLKLEEEIQKLHEEKHQLEEKVKLAQAELVNYRKRKDEEVSSMLKYANEDLIKELIGVVDNFERAISLDDNDLTDDLSKFLSGFKIMYGTLTTILRNFGVEEISRVGEEFDPNLEEALLTDKVEGHKNEEVLEVLLKGYKLKDKVIRPASVKVNMI
jgi:molecular chaperone GrpE